MDVYENLGMIERYDHNLVIQRTVEANSLYSTVEHSVIYSYTLHSTYTVHRAYSKVYSVLCTCTVGLYLVCTEYSTKVWKCMDVELAMGVTLVGSKIFTVGCGE